MTWAVRRRRRARPPAGVVLLALMIGLVVLGLLSMLACDVWAVTRRRELEAQLLFVGEQYRAAIRHYYSVAAAGRPHVYPRSLDDLLEDHRFPAPMRHLRKLYPDPMTGQADWVLDRAGEAIVGVHSASTRQPLKTINFPAIESAFEGKQSYAGWAFDAQSK